MLQLLFALNAVRRQKSSRINDCCSSGGGGNADASTNVTLRQDDRSLPLLYNRLYCYFLAYRRSLALEKWPKSRSQKQILEV